MLERLQRLPDDLGSAMVIGHNPAMQVLVLRLAASGAASELDESGLLEIQRKYPTGALATLEFEGAWSELGPGRARLTGYVRPRQLTRAVAGRYCLLQMRRRLSLIAAVLTVIAGLVIAGCGSSSSSTSPLQTSLSYFPKDSLFVMSLQTDPNSSAIQSAQALLHRFPAVTFGESALIARLQQFGINYDTDIKPLFGNPAVIGVGEPVPGAARDRASSSRGSRRTRTRSTTSSRSSTCPRARRSMDAKVYGVSTAALAVDGSTLVLAASPTAIKSALDLHAHGGGLTPADQSKAMGNLPTDSLVSAFGDLTAVLSQPSAAQAKKVPWVNALKGYGVAISANATGLTFQYRLDTSGQTLSESQLPIAPGSTPPSLAGSQPISVGVSDPSRIVKFIHSGRAARVSVELREIRGAPGRRPREDRRRSHQPAEHADRRGPALAATGM